MFGGISRKRQEMNRNSFVVRCGVWPGGTKTHNFVLFLVGATVLISRHRPHFSAIELKICTCIYDGPKRCPFAEKGLG